MTPATARAMLTTLASVLKTEIGARLDAAAAALAADVRSRLERAGPAGRPSGALAQAITTGRDIEIDAAVVTVDEPYAAALEYGTARMAARPFLRPAAAEAEPEIRDALAATMAETCRDTLGRTS